MDGDCAACAGRAGGRSSPGRRRHGGGCERGGRGGAERRVSAHDRHRRRSLRAVLRCAFGRRRSVQRIRRSGRNGQLGFLRLAPTRRNTGARRCRGAHGTRRGRFVVCAARTLRIPRHGATLEAGHRMCARRRADRAQPGAIDGRRAVGARRRRGRGFCVRIRSVAIPRGVVSAAARANAGKHRVAWPRVVLRRCRRRGDRCLLRARGKPATRFGFCFASRYVGCADSRRVSRLRVVVDAAEQSGARGAAVAGDL